MVKHSCCGDLEQARDRPRELLLFCPSLRCGGTRRRAGSVCCTQQTARAALGQHHWCWGRFPGFRQHRSGARWLSLLGLSSSEDQHLLIFRLHSFLLLLSYFTEKTAGVISIYLWTTSLFTVNTPLLPPQILCIVICSRGDAWPQQAVAPGTGKRRVGASPQRGEGPFLAASPGTGTGMSHGATDDNFPSIQLSDDQGSHSLPEKSAGLPCQRCQEIPWSSSQHSSFAATS